MKNKIYSLGAVVLDHVFSVEEIPKKPVKIKGKQYLKRVLYSGVPINSET